MISRLLSHRLWWAWALFAVFFAFGEARAQTTLSASPATYTVKAGKLASYSLSNAPINTLGAIPQVSITELPPNATCYITYSGDGTTIAEVDTSPGKKGTPKGTYHLTFTGKLGDVITSIWTADLVVR